MTSAIKASEQEIKALIKDTEKCANNIFTAIETAQKQVQKISDKKLQEQISEQLTIILENCHFQDFCGQRGTKVISYLNEIKKGGADIKLKEKTGDARLLNGPELEGANQAEIDKLFNS
ncbi:MAG TPA: hypothetical protein DIV86_05670 [Alphaproteobacteria bacterium]|nr:hypothetical protein [Alphaproteobacteria bacterium]